MDFTMSDDTFNKVVTILLLVFGMGMYIYSYVTGKPLDLSNLFVLAAALLNNTLHLVTRANVQQKAIESDTQKEVAKLTSNGKDTSNHEQ